MKKTIDLLNKAVEMGFERESALQDIDAAIDGYYKDRLEELLPDIGECRNSDRFAQVYDTVIDFIADNRKPLAEEEIPEELYDEVLHGFKCEAEGC